VLGACLPGNLLCPHKKNIIVHKEAVRLLNQVIVDLITALFLAFKVLNIAQIGKGLCLQTLKQSIIRSKA